MANLNRRQFIHTGTATGFAAAGSLLGALSSRTAAADTSGYKAMVGIFLHGGLDHADTVLHYDQPSYDRLSAQRPALFQPRRTSRQRHNLLHLGRDAASGRDFALPPELAGLHSLYTQGEAAIIGNIGPLLEHVTQDDLMAARASLPPQLFSHNDQQSSWKSFNVEGAKFGWGGLLADSALKSSPMDNSRFSSLTASRPDVFLTGRSVAPFPITQGGLPEPRIFKETGLMGKLEGHDLAREMIREELNQVATSEINLYKRDFLNGRARALPNRDIFQASFQARSTILSQFPDTKLGKQMKAIAETMSVQHLLGNSRQVFYASMGGFDTHAQQSASLPPLLAELNDAILAFRNAMQELGQWNNVVVFTMSEFGRTMTGNSTGTDHGWGGHQFVIGGSVAGGQIYGSMPDPDAQSTDYTPTRGRLIPRHSVEQYAATLGRWFGLNSAELRAAMPHLDRFDTDDLGFMG